MERRERAELLKKMLLQIAPGDNIENVARPSLDGGLESIDTGVSPAENGLKKMAEGRQHELTDEEMSGLEAIVLPQNRPVVFVKGDSYDDVEHPWEKLNPSEVKARVCRAFPSVGRIEVPNMPQIPYGGTGFVVGKRLVMTNRHVAKLFSSGLGLKIAYNPGDSVINFRRQIDSRDSDGSAYVEVLGVEMIHPYWDMALLRVADLPDDRVLALSTKMPEALEGRDIVAVGYPAKDWRSDLALQDHIFSGQYNVKRLQPGVLRKRASIRSFANVVNAVTHDASTLGGNSGSAVLDIETNQVLALHFAGEYLKANYAVPMYELARDSCVTAKKLNFDDTLTPTNDWEPAWLLTEDTEATASSGRSQPGTSAPLQSPAPAQTAPVSRAQTPAANVSTSTSSATWTIPIHVDGDHRPDIGTRSGDRWYRDPRIQKTEQLGQEAFESGIDRGHLTRREDTAWGKDVATATAANNDTFHFTNCSLQAAHFNRGKDRWQGIEQFLLEKHAKKDKRRMTVITGPLFAAHDPIYQNGKMDYSVRCPLQYWKVCVLVRDEGSVSATAFLLNQSEIQDLPGFEETFDVAATQVKISDLERKTKLSFGDLKKHNHFAEGGAAGTLEAPTGLEGETQTVKLIFHPSDIVV